MQFLNSAEFQLELSGPDARPPAFWNKTFPPPPGIKIRFLCIEGTLFRLDDYND